MSSVPHGGNMWKNIMIGIVTTVAAYLIVHFILDRKDSKKERKEKAEANHAAWESVNGYILSAARKFESIACFSCDYAKMKNEMIRELEQDCNSLLNIKGGQYVDEKMKTIIDRTISRFNSLKPLFQALFDSVIVINTLPDSVKPARSAPVYKNFKEAKERIDTVDMQEINQLLSDINTKYKLSLAMEGIELELDYTKLTGKWQIECFIDVDFRNDGTLTWTEKGQDYPGTWERAGDRLVIHFASGNKLEYTILELHDKFLKLQADGAPVPYGACRK